MPRPRYAQGTLGRDIADVLRDAPLQTLRRLGIIRAIAKRRGATSASVKNAVAQALHRMARRGDVEVVDVGIYRLTMLPIPDDTHAQETP